jgi:hypothetical protein
MRGVVWTVPSALLYSGRNKGGAGAGIRGDVGVGTGGLLGAGITA